MNYENTKTIAFLASAVVNNRFNWIIGKWFKNHPDGKLAYATRTYVSTFVGQFFDNFLFSIIVFVICAPIFWDGFHWTLLQCTMCVLTGAVAELIMEVLFRLLVIRLQKNGRRILWGKNIWIS